MSNGGILSGPIDLDPGPKRKAYPKMAAKPGLAVVYQPRRLAGTVMGMRGDIVELRDQSGRDHRIRHRPGMFAVEGTSVELVLARAKPAEPDERKLTASGSIDTGPIPARVARASRILVEGIHDAELLEYVWGDDLRVEGVVVEQMAGMDDLAAVVRGFQPRPGRRLGVLLDHLIPGTKEYRVAETVDHPDVLITGHPWVDVWQAVKPTALGIEAWPEIPRGTSWKEGVIAALGVTEHPGRFWKRVLGSVSTYADLEPELVGAVEQLIDFVTEPAG